MLAAEAVECAALVLEGLVVVRGGDDFAVGSLRAGDRVHDYALEEETEDAKGFFVNHGGDTLADETTSEMTDAWVGDGQVVFTKDFSMTTGASLSLSVACHC